ncbi:biotin synthase BioB [Ethanoligenens harbinense]|uniref:Biotin synthase n=1 Tax=Ethanoligenens harbinense (strain DSM 18485 / JCM 12961 / CGMCC 1.5033 / YUAN-3) TaxID=663278 RepID=E6U6V0_ETHHY|nr:biotin synthase BioB [Ethanoligenens harbinense]ADU26917.1 biotin synthase [Ethanoligenens harbinense YUAN-3]AVQ96013.1 biotin synthase BioB [Ethanoligenens harbinense YUAN-3]AYF38674.1 biotin synthase BioB [Ethanoligenens harbinense]AYF41421.1 biotin synthase BioB [Ethanoligenens harbinense]QCN92255.1 biotin synthase BioB [Ethanoligenens harbinense]
MNTLYANLLKHAEAVLSGGNITANNALALSEAEGSDLFLLCALANKIRETFTGNAVDLCSVINAKSGGCTEDCAFCAQSAHHRTNAPCHPLLDEDVIVEMAIRREQAGAKHCDIATSGLGYTGDEPDFQHILSAFRKMREKTSLKICACLGTLTEQAVRALKDCRVERYNHNLETSRSFYSHVSTTHGYDERVQTIRFAKQAGLEVCSGMIIGMGETMAQRIEHAYLLKELDVDAVPVNLLSPVPGTRMENQKPIEPLEALKTFAILRFILPDKNIRYAGGRENGLKTLQPFGLVSGLNGMLIGDYLTLGGQAASSDIEMLEALHLSR